jgi:hypothetical protein
VNANKNKDVVVSKGNKDSSVSKHRTVQAELEQKVKAV